VADGDGHGLRLVADRAPLGDVGVALGLGELLLSLHGHQGRGERGLAVVDMADRADIDVRLAPRERILCHREPAFSSEGGLTWIERENSEPGAAM